MTTARLIDDFAIALREEGEGGQHVEFGSRSNGRLASFPYWDHADRDLRHFNLEDIPFGSEDSPFVDADVDWRIVIFESDGFVNVLEGEAHGFRVPRERYIEAWREIIDGFNPAIPLDELNQG